MRERFHKRIIHLKVIFFKFSSFQHCYLKYQFGPLWPIFGLMTLPQGVKTSKFWDIGFKNEYFISNFPLLLTFIFLSPLVHERQAWGLFDQILGQWRHQGSQNCFMFREWSQKKLLTSKFHQLISIFLFTSIYDTLLWALFTQYGDNDVTRNKHSNILKN